MAVPAESKGGPPQKKKKKKKKNLLHYGGVHGVFY
jgi:hypothetical protein